MRKRLTDARAKTVASLEEAHKNMHAVMTVIASLNDTLREIDTLNIEADAKVEIDAANAGHRLDPKARKALVRVDGSATDFALSVIGLTEGGASTTDLKKVAADMDADFTVGALHAAVHRLVGTGWIVKTGTKKGASYRLTRTGAHEWSELIRKSNVAK